MSFPQIWSQRIFMNPWIWKSTTSDPGFRWWDLDKQNKFNTNIRKNTFSPFGHHILQKVFFLMQKNSSWKNTFSRYSRKMLEEFVGWGKMIDSMFFFRLEEPSAVGSNVLSFARKAIYPQLTSHWLFTSPLQTIILQKNGSWTTTFFFHLGLFKGFSKANCEFLVSWKKFYLDITVEYPSYHSKTPTLSSHWLLIDPESGQSQGHQCFFQVSFEIFPPI